MVGLSDIPCLQKAAETISNYAMSVLFRGLKYMICYKSLVDDFNTNIQKLNIEEEKISRRVQGEKDNGKTLEEDVLSWQTSAKDIQKKDKELSPSLRCIQCLPIPNPVSRLRLGREAVKKSETVIALIASANELLDKNKDIAYHPQQSEDVPYTDTVFEDFGSRKEVYKRLLKQLESEASMILGIYGMPGVGKTRMMAQIWQEVQKKTVYDKVTLAVVASATYDVLKLQDQLALRLNCIFESPDDSKNRAGQLKRSMMNSGKILVIFDDVWSEISLHDIIGISSSDGDSWKGSKILFTSRNKSYCIKNGCMDPVEITVLEDDEALYMFENTISIDQIQFPPSKDLVQQVCRKCAGLPLVIHALGKALQVENSSAWGVALKQLEDCKIENVEGIKPGVYGGLKFSFDNLPKDAKQCLFLCSLFEADHYFDIDILSDIVAGSQLVQGGRTELLSAVDALKSAHLLFEIKGHHIFKLHDIIRVVARSVAIKEHAFFIEKCGWKSPGNWENCDTWKVMQLELEMDDFNFPDHLVCRDLHTIWLNATRKGKQKLEGKINIPNFPSGKFLDLRLLVLENLFWEQQLHLEPLDKLETLLILDCNIVSTDVTCFPESLVTLCIWDSYLPTHLDFGKLKKLRKLEIVNGINDLQMVPNTISGLTCLEELHLQIPDWVDCPRTCMPKFNEISNLGCLTSLIIYWSDFEPVQDTGIFGRLVHYNILVGVLDGKHIPSQYGFVKKQVELVGKLEFESFRNLLERAEIVILRNTDVDISRIMDSNTEAFKDLRNLYIEYSDSIEYLASISPDEIQSTSPQRSSFSNLITLKIIGCSVMKYLFSSYVAKSLVQLQEFHVADCVGIEVIVRYEGENDGDLINFSKLRLLQLLDLPNLKSFYGKRKDTHSGLTSMTLHSAVVFVQPQPQPFFDGTVAFPSLEILEIRGLNHTVSTIWGKHYHNVNVNSFWELRSLKVSMCSGLENVLQHSSLASHLIMHLKKMNVSSCEMMREIIRAGEQQEIPVDGKIVFSELTKLKLVNLPNFSSLWCSQDGEANTYKITFPALVKFTLEDLEINLKLIELGRDGSPCQLEHLNLIRIKETQLPTAWRPHLYDIKSLNLRDCLSEVLISLDLFQRLKLLKVSELKCSILFPLSVLESLQQLQELNISNCILLEGIVDDASGEFAVRDKRTITLSNLRSVSLEELPNLRSFFHNANYELHMPALVYVRFSKCGLFTLFTCSVLQKLKQLKELSVDSCELLEGIVADTRGTEASGTRDKIITLHKLSSLKLENLPNLKSFIYGANYELHMPAVVNVGVFNCGLSTLFTCSVLQKLIQLEVLFVESCELLQGIVADTRGIEASDTNDKIIALPKLSLVSLDTLPNLKTFIHGVNYELHMPALEAMKIANCIFTTLFPFSVFQTLQQLKWLVVYECKLLESIVGDARGIKTSDTKIFTLPQLSHFLLEDLPNFKSLSLTVGCALNMPMLLEFRVFSCPRIKNITSLKTGKRLVNVFSEWHDGEEVPDLNHCIRQYQKFCDSAKQQPLNVAFSSLAWACPWPC